MWPVDALPARRPRRGRLADRAFAANVLGTLCQTVSDRIPLGAERAAGAVRPRPRHWSP